MQSSFDVAAFRIQNIKFRSSLFKGLWGQGAKPLSRFANREIFYTHKRSGSGREHLSRGSPKISILCNLTTVAMFFRRKMSKNRLFSAVFAPICKWAHIVKSHPKSHPFFGYLALDTAFGRLDIHQNYLLAEYLDTANPQPILQDMYQSRINFNDLTVSSFSRKVINRVHRIINKAMSQQTVDK